MDFKKIGKGLGAVAWGTASFIGYIISEYCSDDLHEKAKKLRNNSVTSSGYTADDLEMNSQIFKGYRDKCEEGLSKAKELWKNK